MFIAGVLIFSAVVPVLAYFVTRSEDQDKGKVAATLSLVAWGSLLFGLLLTKVQNY